MATAATNLLTAEEFYEWANRPENRDRSCELVRGEIVEMSRGGKLHGFVCCNVAYILYSFARRRARGYVCSNDTGVIVERDPDTVRGPDVLFCEDATTVDEIDRKYGEHPPLLAVEVLSPNDTTGKIMKRVTEQLQSGTRLVWVVDPASRNVTVFQSGKEPYVLEENGELSGEDVLPDFRCQVAEFFNLPGK